ncbi:MAG: hypothetical protein HC786_20420 [Richelia sp. CSU_2_1]|nr:hypothetical protein [Richelia sp. CSU_2_1]
MEEKTKRKKTKKPARKVPARLQLISIRSDAVVSNAYTRVDATASLGISPKTLTRWERRLRVYVRAFRHRDEGEPLSDFQYWCLAQLKILLLPTHGRNSDKMIAEAIRNNLLLFTGDNYYASQRSRDRTQSNNYGIARANAG